MTESNLKAQERFTCKRSSLESCSGELLPKNLYLYIHFTFYLHLIIQTFAYLISLDLEKVTKPLETQFFHL